MQPISVVAPLKPWAIRFAVGAPVSSRWIGGGFDGVLLWALYSGFVQRGFWREDAVRGSVFGDMVFELVL